MKAIRKIVLSLAALFSTLTMAAVYTPKSVPSPKDQGQEFYVADPDTLLNDSDVVFLNRCARMLEDATQVELCVVVLRSIGDADAFDFSYELFQTWGIGARGKVCMLNRNTQMSEMQEAQSPQDCRQSA
jgi:uncharacterized protein